MSALKVKKGCGQRKNKRDKAGRARHAEICRILRRYPHMELAAVEEQLPKHLQLSR